MLGESICIVEWFNPSLNTVELENFTGCQLFDFSLFPHADRADLFPGLISIEKRIRAFEKSSGKQVLRLADDEFDLITI